MTKTNFEDALWSVRDMLENKVADYLDVNRLHVKITFINTDLVYENYPDCVEEGEPDWFETYYAFGYQYRKSVKNCDYEEEVVMIWQHNEVDGDPYDIVMTTEDFDKHFEEHEHGEPIQHYTFKFDFDENK